MLNFAKCFELLTGNPPFTWQTRLYERFLADDIPSACDIPTGLGKTSVIVIWLLALAEKMIENSQANKIPRRLVYVVDRRVIVDQATKEAENILDKIIELKDSELESESEIKKIYEAFRNNSFLDKDDKQIIALSTLRGEFADNREWCLDPSRPAIIVGTIDMIGSRLLFSAYGGVGESYKALQAGLLGQDSLIIVDEAHLSPAFVELLKSLPTFIQRKDVVKPFSVMFLSATLDEKTGDADKILSLEKDAPEDLINEVAEPRLNAKKHIEWRSYSVSEEVSKSKKSAELILAEQAKEMAKVAAMYKDLPVSVIVFGRTVELVKRIQAELIDIQKVEENQVLRMTGGMRGYERDELLINNPIFERFFPQRPRDKQGKAYFLIATSVAEVGVNLDADFAVCDPTYADSFVQRLGRINRFGNVRAYVENDLNEEQRQKLSEITNGKLSSVVSIVYQEDSNEQKREIKETSETLKQHSRGEDLNASPLILRQINFSDECNPPKPVSPPLDSARIDDWAMTSLKQEDFRRPFVSYWLRGLTENKTAETSLCWRADLNFADTKNRKISTVKTVRVGSYECARESTSRAVKTMFAIGEKFGEEYIVLIDPGNNYQCLQIKDLLKSEKNIQAEKEYELFAKLVFSTIVLPCEVGGLDENGITVEDASKLTLVKDVVEKPKKTGQKTEWLRVILDEGEDGVTAAKISDEPFTFEFNYRDIQDAVKKIAGEDRRCIRQIKMNLPSQSEEDEMKRKRVLAYFISKTSAEAYLPNEAESDHETEGETASIGYEEDKAKHITGEVLVEKHNADVGDFARQLAAKLYLNNEFTEALEIAGKLHDNGKSRQCWQAAVGNYDYPKKALAKSEQNWFNHKYNNYYRHEFGSLIEAEESAEVTEHPLGDLILHLIAAHHGYARPHFPERAFDQENPTPLNQQVAERAMLRFAKLQIKYGWWQLAYLEAILKSADALASRAEARGEI